MPTRCQGHPRPLHGRPRPHHARCVVVGIPAVDGVLSGNVADGLPAGFYRMASYNTAANSQPALVAIAQHGSLDDMVYFTVQ